MKKQLLLGTALLAAISAFPQSSDSKGGSSLVKRAGVLSSKYLMVSNNRNPVENTPGISNIVKPVGPQNQFQRSTTSSATWFPLSGSMNIYGVLVGASKPLQYNDDLDAVSFVHRKSFTYVTSPVASPSAAASGAIEFEVSGSLSGTTWDSTLVWNSNTNYGRYPTGGIYNPPGNTSLANAYGVASGPITTAASSWSGNFFASKKLDTPGGTGYNNVASTTPNAQQFIANTAPFGALGKIDFARCKFTCTDDGVVRIMGDLMNNANGTTFATQYLRGTKIAKGTFNSGVFTWSGDSIVPSVIVTSGGQPHLYGDPQQAWNEAGTIGYVWLLGARSGATGANKGIQPIVYKTTDGGATWSIMPGINFNNGAVFNAPVLDHLGGIHGTTLTVPFFDWTEGMDGVVDYNGNLHLVTTISTSYSSDNDSLLYTAGYTNADGEQYSYPHSPGARPYIYDFTSTPSGSFNVTVIDSMSSEGPGTRSTDNGYAANPWDATGGSGTDKVDVKARIQASRTPDGKVIVYTWVESDTSFTSSSQKWNTIPNIKARSMNVVTGFISPTEINVTNPPSGANVFVASRAHYYYASPVCKVTNTTSTNYTVTLPLTVSNNQNTPLTQLLPNTHWYSSAKLDFVGSAPVTVGLSTPESKSVMNSVVYPNPAKNNASLLIDLKESNSVNVVVMNVVGSVVKTSVVEGTIGSNEINLDLNGLSAGVYMVNVKVGNASSSKKLIIE